MNLLVDSTIKVSLLVVLGLGASALLQKRSAALRHWVLTVTILCSAVIRWWRSSCRPGTILAIRLSSTDAPAKELSPWVSVERSFGARNRRRSSPTAGLVQPRFLVAWIAGMVTAGILLLDSARLTSIASHSEPLVRGNGSRRPPTFACMSPPSSCVLLLDRSSCTW